MYDGSDLVASHSATVCKQDIFVDTDDASSSFFPARERRGRACRIRRLYICAVRLQECVCPVITFQNRAIDMVKLLMNCYQLITLTRGLQHVQSISIITVKPRG